MDQMNDDQLSGVELQIDEEVRRQFETGAKWSKFISITIFIACGLFLLICLAGSTVLISAFSNLRGFGSLAGMGGGLVIVLLFLVIAVIVVLYYFLFNFSSKIRQALITGNSDTMNTGISSLKVFFIISGVFGILSVLMALVSLFQTSQFL